MGNVRVDELSLVFELGPVGIEHMDSLLREGLGANALEEVESLGGQLLGEGFAYRQDQTKEQIRYYDLVKEYKKAHL
jgi:hypothetical protein